MSGCDVPDLNHSHFWYYSLLIIMSGIIKNQCHPLKFCELQFCWHLAGSSDTCVFDWIITEIKSEVQMKNFRSWDIWMITFANPYFLTDCSIHSVEMLWRLPSVFSTQFAIINRAFYVQERLFFFFYMKINSIASCYLLIHLMTLNLF